ncbi:MAG TPA: N-acetylmuramoyl-L-alanine amidase [Gammaproteobacteria bacterium]
MKQGVVWLALAGLLAAVVGVAEAATVENIRLWSGPESTRVVLDLSGPVEHRVFELTDPDRVVIDLARSSMGERTPPFEPKGYVANLRTGSRPNGELRVVLDLKHAVRPRSFLLPPAEGYGHRLVIDLLPPSDPANVTRAATGGAVRDLVIAIDAGHGGEDPGAIGHKGTREKDVVLAIARKLAAEIREQPGMRPVMIRDGDYLVSHRRRMQIAREAGADFFISIHADSYRDASAKGVTVYALSEKGATDEAALLVAHRENGAELRGGVSLADMDRTLARVLVDLSQGATLSASAAAAERVIRRLGAVATLRKTHVQRAPFLVLKSPDIPSLLIETGYISNPREEGLLRDPGHQAKLAGAMRAGIVDYFRANPPPGTYFARGEEPAAPPAEPIAEVRAVPVRHVITRGETLSGIAARYHVTTTSLKRSNRLRGDVIRVGQVLTIPQGG